MTDVEMGNEQRILEIKARVYDIMVERNKHNALVQEEAQKKQQDFEETMKIEIDELSKELSDLE